MAKKRSAQGEGGLARLRAWLESWPGFAGLEALEVDYTPQAAGSGGLYPRGAAELGRTADILGAVAVRQRREYKLTFVLPKPPGDGVAAAENAARLLEFQQWVQRQSALGLAPRFGNAAPEKEALRASAGALKQADEGGLAVYTVLLTAEYTMRYEVI